MMLDSYSLIPNIRKVVLRVYDETGNPKSGTASDIYANTARNMFHAYLATRDRDLRPLVQRELDDFQKESKAQALETACRNHTKQCFERAYNEANLFSKIFSVAPLPDPAPESAFQALSTGHRWLVTPANLKPLAQSLQGALQGAELQSLCNFIGWLTHEYLVPDYLDEESPFTVQCCQYTATLLSEHLWAFTDAAFEAETARTVTRAEAAVEATYVHSVLKRAVELLVMFDQCMPKERCVSTPTTPAPQTSTDTRTATGQPGGFQNRPRDDRRPTACRDEAQVRQVGHGCGPLHDQESPRPKE